MDFLIYTNCMVFYRTPWTCYGVPWNSIGTSGNPMALHGTLRYSMEFHGPPRNSINTSRNSMELHDIPWNSDPWILHRPPWHIPWNSVDTPWIPHGSSMEFHRIPWISIDFHGFPVHGIPWRYFTRVRECNLSLQNTVELLL